MITDYSEVVPHLFITNWESSNDPNLLTKYNIKAVLTAEQTPKPDYFVSFANRKGIDHMQIYIDDSPSEKISDYFDSTFDFINRHIQKNENVVIHCMMGVSRSVTLALNYLLKKMFEEYPEEYSRVNNIDAVNIALDHVRLVRPFVNPNPGFIKQLADKVNEYRNLKNSNKKRDLNYPVYNTNTPKQMSSDDCAGFVAADGQKGKVIALSNNDFDQQGNLINFPNVSGTIMYYADWCGHCKTLKPKYAEYSNKLNGNNRAFVVNADKNKDLLGRINVDSFGYKVQGFPTMVGYHNGKYYSNYSPDPQGKHPFRSAEDLMDYSQGLGTAEIHYE